ncbi:MAG: hypothetical protein AMJ53_04720 [Gammaproteobacteria bacterium SG8_11]|nr:MAG: hypothetical protein AMJ53_04720 [Gammaproteobacteria bacterium SG8_11]
MRPSSATILKTYRPDQLKYKTSGLPTSESIMTPHKQEKTGKDNLNIHDIYIDLRSLTIP